MIERETYDYGEVSYPTDGVKMWLEYVKRSIENVREKWVQKYDTMSLHERQQARLLAAVLAHNKTETKTFTDEILKKTSFGVLDKRQRWLENDLMRNKKIIESAAEHEDLERKRAELRDKIESLEEGLKILKIIM